MADAVPTILVVDDQPGVRFFLEEVLQGEGYDVVTADCGEVALEQIATQTFDVAVIDLVMKDVSGIDVLHVLKRDTPRTAAIVLTAHGSLETAVQALRQGAHDYLFKPCKTAQLRDSVRTALVKARRETRRLQVLSELEGHLTRSLGELRDPMAEPSPTGHEVAQDADVGGEPLLCHGDLVVDLSRHLVQLAGEDIPLSATQFNVLAYLVQEAPRVVPPEELACDVLNYEEPWEAGETVRYHIYRIRQKIEDTTGREDLINTVRGVGYSVGDRGS